MKGAYPILAAIGLLLALTGCGGNSGVAEPEPPDAGSAAPTSSAAQTSEPPPPPAPAATATEAVADSLWPTAADDICVPAAEAADAAKAGSPDAEAKALNLSVVARDVADALAALPTETAAEQEVVDAADRWADAWGVFAVAIYDGTIEEASAAGEDSSAALVDLTAAFDAVAAGECLQLASKF